LTNLSRYHSVDNIFILIKNFTVYYDVLIN
jgi:hypothetical protein